jgi:hypothetical protein
MYGLLVNPNMNKDLKFLIDEFQREKLRHQNFINLATECLQNLLDIQDEIIKAGMEDAKK